MGYDYEICYRGGKENIMAGVLSRITAIQLLALTVSEVNSKLLEQIKQLWNEDTHIQETLRKINQGEQVPHFNYSQGLLYKKGRLVVGNKEGIYFSII